MIIKNESKCKKTGKITTSYTSDKPGHKVVIKQGKPVEEKMSADERSNRDHGGIANGHGAEGSSMKQKGKTRVNVEAEKQYREKMQEGKIDPLTKANKKVDILKQKLRKAKLDQMEIQLVKREAEIVKKENKYSSAEKFVQQDRKKLKDKHSYYTTDDLSTGKTEKLRQDITDKIKNIVGEDEDTEKTIKESIVGFEERLDKTIELNKIVFGKPKKKTCDILESLDKKINEADDDEEVDQEDKKDKNKEDQEKDAKKTSEGDAKDDEKALEDDGKAPEEDDGEAPEEDDGEADEELDGEDGQNGSLPNEIHQIVDREEFNVNTENAYDFYDFIIDKIISNNARRSLNIEYNMLPSDKRKVTPASNLFDRVTKRLDVLDKAEQQRLEDQMTGEAPEEEI